MTTTKLISLTDIQELKGISSNVNIVKQLNPFIIEAQEMELRPFLGDEFYLALLADAPTFANYGDLFNGVDYTYNGHQYRNDGIKPMLIYYAYARYLNNAQAIITPNGVVSKNFNDSTPTSDKNVAKLVNQAFSGGKIYENRVLDYLVRNSEDYPLYKCINSTKRTGGLRISSIRK